MTIGETRIIYSNQIGRYSTMLGAVSKRQKELDEQIKATPGNKDYEDEAYSLSLTYDALSKKYDEYRDYMSKLMEQYMGQMALESSKQAADAEAEAFDDMAKIMTVARRLMHGDIVPYSDEKKLMEYDAKLYMMAKNAQMMAQLEERKKYDSLWDDEEPEEEQASPEEVASGMEAVGGAPSIESPESIAAENGVSIDISA